MIFGVTVLYNPTKEIFENISSYIEGIEKLYLIDNSEMENQELKNQLINFSSKIEYIKMNGNEGIAKALNISKNKALENKKVEWLLTMDQDSKFKMGDFKKFSEIIEKKFDEKVAIYSPYHYLNNDIFPEESTNEKVAVMTSGNLLNLKISKKIGDFDENFFIDEVDHDYCYRIKEWNYKIVVINKILLEHKLGNLKKHIFCSVTHHNYIRRYYITRNKLYMIKKYKYLKNQYITSLLIDFIKILLFEKNKAKKIKMFFLGIKDYRNNIYGKINSTYI